MACLLVMTISNCKVEQKADLLIFNGKIYTADSLDNVVEAMAIKNGLIIATGDKVSLNPWIDNNTAQLDLLGDFVMPGLIEGHGHFLSLGKSLYEINLLYTRSWQEIVELSRKKVSETEDNIWIEGRGWHQEKWISDPGLTVDGYPYHDALSAISPNHPVVLVHASGHALMANQKAMDLARISPETSSPIGGRIVKDDQGRLTGVFEENAMSLITKPLNDFLERRSEAEKKEILTKQAKLATAASNRYGITSFQDAGSSFDEIKFLKSLCDSNQISIRLWVMLLEDDQQLEASAAHLPIPLNSNKNFASNAVKAYVDGALGSYGAWLLEDYDDKPGHTGQNTLDIEKLKWIAELCRNKNLQCCVHGIGDRGNREILNVFEDVLQNEKHKDLRWRIEHAQHLNENDIPRFGRLGVIASMQSIHCTSDAPFVEKRLGQHRAKTGAYAWRSLVDSGARLANGTDCPVESENPYECIYAAVTRKRIDNGFTFYPEQSLSRLEALKSYTIWNAYAAKEEHIKGSLEVGKLADFIVLDRDLMLCEDKNIPGTKVKKVFLSGEEIYIE